MLTDAFDYALPPELIAQTPIEPRDASRLLVIDRAADTLAHRTFRDLTDYLRPGDLLVVNETRVIPARLHALKLPTGGKVELLLLAKRGPTTWEALVTGRKVAVGQRLALAGIVAGGGEEAVKPSLPRDIGPAPASSPLQASVAGTVEAITPSGGRLIRFDQPIEPHLHGLGTVPLPPYIHTPLADSERYQTIYAREEGSVAAPTAGLHFTPNLRDRLRDLGVEWTTVLLHIGLDTFRPVTEAVVEEHRVHTEYCRVSAETADCVNRAVAEGRRVIAVGTTSVRVLETAAQGVARGVQPCDGPTELFIYPGYRFRVVDALITNFHLPRSSLLMLVAAFAGLERIRHVYAEATRLRYRFYSFGDSMLIL